MTEDEFITSLRQFNQRADELLSSEFMQQILSQGGTSSQLKWTAAAGVSYSSNLPEKDRTKAFVLDYRFFIQDNEPVSLRNMQARFDMALTEQLVSGTVHERFTEARKRLNRILDEPSLVQFSNDGALRLRDLIDIFIYGRYAHENPEMSRLYNEISVMPQPFVSLTESEFKSGLARVATVIKEIQLLNLELTNTVS